jgi:hypothetical protein
MFIPDHRDTMPEALAFPKSFVKEVPEDIMSMP